MKEFIDKLIERLEEYKDSHLIEHDSEECLHCKENEDDWCVCRNCNICVWDKTRAIVKELAEEYKPKTQAGKIRSMSDEELADYIIFVGGGYNEKIPYCKSIPQCTEILDSGRIVPNEMCRECLVKWLQSEAE